MDQNKFINAYVDSAVGMLHENINSILQLKAHNKVANDLIQEKDQIIGDLQNRLNSVENNDSDVKKAKDQAKHWEDSYHAMSAKVAHMDTLLNQIKDMKAIILEKDKIIVELNATIENFKTPKKVINKKTAKHTIVEKQPTDDF